MKPSNVRSVEELLGWGALSEWEEFTLVIGAAIMKYKRVVTVGLLIVLALVIGWGVTRDPFVLAAALLVGFVTGAVSWLLR